MSINNDIYNRIEKIDWFANCGNHIKCNSVYKIYSVNSWEETADYYEDSLWESFTMDAKNELTLFLNEKYYSKYQEWNGIIMQAKKFISEKVDFRLEIIKEKYNLSQVFIDCVHWDIMMAIMENAYKECHRRPTFFLNILEIYESGNFPCGWIGDKKDGKLVVF